MKKLLVCLLAVGLLSACNNDKTKSRDRDRSESRERDDYKSDDRDKENTREDDSKSEDVRTTSGSWSSTEVNAFVTNCVSEASKPGPTGERAMTESKASEYCNCMVRKFQKLYPNPLDAANVTDADLNSASMQEMMKECLGL